MKLVSKIAGISVLAVAASAVAFVPAHADAAKTVTVRQGDLIKALSDTRTAGKVTFLKDGLHVQTTGATSQSKAAEYFSVSGSLPTSASIDWTGTQPQAGAQIVFDADDINDNGNDYNVLVVEPAYQGNAWLTSGSSDTAKAADPSQGENGGNGSDYFGTLAEWKSALPKARVYAGGFALGSGVEGNGTISSIAFDDTTYDFTNQGAATKVIRKSDLISGLADTRSAGTVTFLKDGLQVTTVGATPQSKAAEYFPATGSLPTSASLDWTGTQPQASTQIVFDADGITGNGNDYNILVGEPVYGANFWLTNGSSATAKASDPSGKNNGGNGSAYFGTLAQWKAALPSTARVYAAGFSLGSGVEGNGTITSITVGDTNYTFTSDAAPTTPVSPAPPAKVKKDVTGHSTAKKVTPRKVRLDLYSKALRANTVEGKRLGWKIKVDGRTAFATRQHAADHDRWSRAFAKNTGRHQIQLFKNGKIVRTIKVNTKA